MGRRKREFKRVKLNIRIEDELSLLLDYYCEKYVITRTKFVEIAILEKILKEKD